jgi:uncharacterized protein YllA (UPF0747 family)
VRMATFGARFVRIVEEFDADGRVRRRTVESNREMSVAEVEAAKAAVDETLQDVDRVFREVDGLFERASERMSRIFKGR